MSWNRESPPVFANEHAVAALLMPPVDAMLSCNCLQIGDLPVARIATHSGNELCSCVHAAILPVKLRRGKSRAGSVLPNVAIEPTAVACALGREAESGQTRLAAKGACHRGSVRMAC